ncbi:MAG: hypothetical protein ABI574_13880 [Burkholderiales bacterium]
MDITEFERQLYEGRPSLKDGKYLHIFDAGQWRRRDKRQGEAEMTTSNPWSDLDQIKQQLRSGRDSQELGKFVPLRDAALWVSTHQAANIVAHMENGSRWLWLAISDPPREDELRVETFDDEEGGSYGEWVSLDVVVKAARNTGNDGLVGVLLDELESRQRNDVRIALLIPGKGDEDPRSATEDQQTSSGDPRRPSDRHSDQGAAPAGYPTLKHSTAKRKLALAAVFARAIDGATDPHDPDSVWAALVSLTMSKNAPPELLDYHEDKGIQAIGARNGWLTIRDFKKRWRDGNVRP